MRIALVILVIMIAILVYYDPSKEYWENVGPTWDRTLNPCTHNPHMDGCS